MRKPLLFALAASAALSLAPNLAAAQWMGDGYVVHRAAGPCRTFREWRHGELRIIRTCRPSYGRWDGPRAYGAYGRRHGDWEQRRYHERRWHDDWGD
jgi:hypothetical protein